MKASIFKAEIKDMEILNSICFDSKMYWNYPPEWMEKWKDELELKANDLLSQHIFKMQEESGSIAGFCSVKENEAEYEILHLWIRPEFIGKGYGKYLLRESLHRVAVKEKPVIVEADPNAEKFYASQGFTTFDYRQSYPEGRLLPLMKMEQAAR